MKVTLTREPERWVAEQLRGGRYAETSDVMRDALRTLELRNDFKSPALAAALLEGVRGAHRSYGKATLARIHKAARGLK